MTTRTFQTNDNDSSPSKRMKFNVMKQRSARSKHGTEHATIILAEPGFELIFIENPTGNDGCFHPLRLELQKENSEIVSKLNLVMLAKRSISENDHETLFNTDNNCARLSLIRTVEFSDPKSRRLALNEIVNFLNECDIQNPPSNKGRTNQKHSDRIADGVTKCMMAEEFDLTPLPNKPLKKLCACLTPKAIVELIYKSCNNVDRCWAQRNASLSTKFFNEPHPADAQAGLGCSSPIHKPKTTACAANFTPPTAD